MRLGVIATERRKTRSVQVGYMLKVTINLIKDAIINDKIHALELLLQQSNMHAEDACSFIHVAINNNKNQALEILLPVYCSVKASTTTTINKIINFFRKQDNPLFSNLLVKDEDLMGKYIDRLQGVTNSTVLKNICMFNKIN